METKNIVVSFVELVLKYEQWKKVKKLSNDEVQVLFETVSAAGFEPKKIVLGKLKGDYHDQDGRTGETYPINKLCPYKVISQEGSDYYFATGWLDCAFCRVVFGASRKGEDHQKLIEAICVEIKRSVPFQPIQLTPEGDLLQEYPRQPLSSGLEYFVDHARDNHELTSCVGVHKYCGGCVYRHRATNIDDALVCRACHLRVLFPKKVKTYGELRQALASRRVQVPA